MGLDPSSVSFLCAAKSLGVDFTHTAMIGRQTFWPDAATLRRVFAVLDIQHDAREFLRQNKYSEPFFALLGARTIESLDASKYESATHIHDMNLPLPADLRERFTLVHDGGTLEHVFNITQALRNCMEMVKVGGHFTQVNVANNYMGHGFWQFSPEMIYRAFSLANGFQIEAVMLHEVVPRGAWYVVRDPEQVRRRVELCNRRPTYILTIARRVAAVDIFASPPQQSDYVAAWNRSTENRPPATQRTAGVRRCIPRPVQRAVRSALKRLRILDQHPAFHQACYRRIDEDALLRGKLA
jgi:hypothetical protein